jgi:LmbE family N-acetylglucosaminyl deacetylase
VWGCVVWLAAVLRSAEESTGARYLPSCRGTGDSTVGERYGRRQLLAGGLGGAAALFLAQTGTAAARTSPLQRSLSLAAHADDVLLFMNPDVSTDIKKGNLVRSVVLTAGDHGLGSKYWQSREAGMLVAFAHMAGVGSFWNASTLTANGHVLGVQTLASRPKISVIFMRLPDGDSDGSGFALDNNESLETLWTGSLSNIHTVDASTSYTKQDLIDTVTSIMVGYQPDIVRTQDYVGAYGHGDHSDHYTTAYLTQAASQAYGSANQKLVGYWGYPTAFQPANVSGRPLMSKYNTFLAYAAYDLQVPHTRPKIKRTYYGAWLARQYPVSANSTPISGALSVPDA